ncbi:hypothetical protein TSUD_255700 [Trifolium subterraneum]|uniref:PA domain-containing protein n=1 Tax=Trifolium subterraneum TaxID=3900 RepID=A0A2Z6MND3_TRISU|nr:hypothetical protein TSUD_255700 [Trifolium subterraneum]
MEYFLSTPPFGRKQDMVKIQSLVTLIQGTSLSSKDLPSDEFYPLISAKDAKHFYVLSREAKFCRYGTLDAEKAKGKIVVCLEDELFGIPNVGADAEVSSAGAVGMILASDYKSFYDFTAYPHVLPTSHVNYSDGQYIYSYIQSEK